LPGGVRIDPRENEAVISFWVGKTGRIIGAPEVIKHAADPKVAQSAVRAILDSAPFPPLPDNYTETEAHVLYTFVPAG
jgi:TonB family protein